MQGCKGVGCREHLCTEGAREESEVFGAELIDSMRCPVSGMRRMQVLSRLSERCGAVVAVRIAGAGEGIALRWKKRSVGSRAGGLGKA